ncbi:zinc finger CCHC domain-containing protein 9-like [Tubulanus polymorphus]|uniref:zinc finger CCHC domain-containing protein 9-like n=1 Tax=Tubulanus polymorphus TaxID=672921 RepID=UPI003DA3BB2D
MTRWARSGTANTKKPLDSTPWSDMKKDTDTLKTKMKTFQEKDERREKRRIKRINNRQNKVVCFKCRKEGHTISECTEITNDIEQGTGICFKCGSTEHAVAKCRVKVPAGTFPFAKCFICKEQGHLSNQCPDNPRGLYPKGGSCKTCGSVEHFNRDCPELQNKKAVESEQQETIDTIDLKHHRSADEEPAHLKKPKPKPLRKGPKIVKF